MLLIKNIKELVQVEEKPVSYRAGDKMQEMHTLKDAWLLIEKDKIKDFGLMKEMSPEAQKAKECIDVEGRMVFPCFCDSQKAVNTPDLLG